MKKIQPVTGTTLALGNKDKTSMSYMMENIIPNLSFFAYIEDSTFNFMLVESNTSSNMVSLNKQTLPISVMSYTSNPAYGHGYWRSVYKIHSYKVGTITYIYICVMGQVYDVYANNNNIVGYFFRFEIDENAKMYTYAALGNQVLSANNVYATPSILIDKRIRDWVYFPLSHYYVSSLGWESGEVNILDNSYADLSSVKPNDILVFHYSYVINTITKNITVTPSNFLPFSKNIMGVWISTGPFIPLPFDSLNYQTLLGINKILVCFVETWGNLKLQEYNSLASQTLINTPVKDVLIDVNVTNVTINIKRKWNKIIIWYWTKIITIDDTLDVLTKSNTLDIAISPQPSYIQGIVDVPYSVDTIICWWKYLIISGSNISLTTLLSTPVVYWNDLFLADSNIYNYLTWPINITLALLQVIDWTFLNTWNLETIDYLVSWISFKFEQPAVNTTPTGTTVAYEYSTDSGVTWLPFTVNIWNTATFAKIRFRIVLSTTSNTVTPTIPSQTFKFWYQQ